jgi:pimeloyl-ACP methyl ester carboxylesterase
VAQPKKQCGEKGGDKPLAGRSGERRGGVRPTVLRDSLMRYSQHERGSKHHRQEVFHLAQRVNDIVLVHGGFVDGSGWAGVYRILENDGFNVSIVQNPTLSLEGDVGATKLIIDQQPGDVILVGHSYGGAVITQAGTHKKVAGLVYITAFAPDAGESVNTLIANPPPGAPVPPILPPISGYLFLDKEKFAASFAGDVDASTAKFMAVSQVPWGLEAVGGTITIPAWKSKPSWYLLVSDDKMIPLPAQQFMCERAGAIPTQVPGSHAIYVSNPSAVAALIKTAAMSQKLASV